MVYVLRHIMTGETVVMGVNSKYSFGRSRIKNVLLRDQSCSHKHAVVQIKDGYATLLDLNSKRGTYVNDQKIHDETKLRNGDVIRFGVHNCKYSFIDPQFQTVIANNIPLNAENSLQEVLNTLNVTVSESYSSKCTHFTSECVNLDLLKTTQMLDALIDRKPVVTASFWERMCNNLQEAEEIPNIYKYMPQIEDALTAKGVKSIVHKEKRNVLFKDKMCIFFDVTLEKRMENLICKCGGATGLHNGQASFATTLVQVRDFEEAIVITESPPGEESLTETYFIDKLKQYDKNVLVLSEDDILVTVLRGYWENMGKNGSRQDKRQTEDDRSDLQECLEITIDEDPRDQDACPEGDTLVQQPQRSSSRNDHTVKKKNTKTKWTTLNRWVQPAKKPNTTSVEAKSEKFDTSLSMSSDDSSDVQEIKLPDKEKNNGRLLCINSDISDGEDPAKSTAPQSKHKNGRYSTSQEPQVIVVEDSNSEDIVSLTRIKRKEWQFPTSDSSESDDIQRQTKPRRSKDKNKSDILEAPQEQSREGISSREIKPEVEDRLNSSTSYNTTKSGLGNEEKPPLKPSKDVQEGTNGRKNKWLEIAFAEEKPEVPKKKLKVNPFARFQNTSTPKKNAMNDVLVNKNMEHSRSNAFKCFLHCLLTKYGWMDEDGGFLLHDIRRTLQQSDVEIPSLEYILYVCTAVKSMNRCQRALLFTECFWKKMEEKQPGEDEFFYNVDQRK